MGNLASAIQFEQQNKPAGSHLIVANSSETVIPAARGFGTGVGDLIDATVAQSNELVSTMNNNTASVIYNMNNGLKSQIAAMRDQTKALLDSLFKLYLGENSLMRKIDDLGEKLDTGLNKLVEAISQISTNATGGGGGGGGVSSSDKQVGQWADIINRVSAETGVPAELIAKVMKQESGGRNNQTSSSGAQGLMQLTPATAQDMGVTNVWDPEQNIRGGAKRLSQMLKVSKGNVRDALTMYNQGPAFGPKPRSREASEYADKVLGQQVTMDQSNVLGGSASSDGLSGLSSNPDIRQGQLKAIGVGKQLLSMGYDVSENPWFSGAAYNAYFDAAGKGRIGGHDDTTGPYSHYTGRALDVNWGPDIANEPAKLTALYKMLQSTSPKKLLWGADVGHTDHLHVAYGMWPAIQGGAGPAFFPTQDAALKWERTMAPRNAAIASVTSNSREFRDGGPGHTFNNTINIATSPDQDPQDIADTVIYELERRVATVRSSSLFFS